MDTLDPLRRTLLRGTVAAGIALLVGCDGKRESAAVPPRSPGGSSPPPSMKPDPAGATVAESGTKLSKAQVQYQTEPKGEQRCATCMHFIPKSRTCKLVEGPISLDGWCTLWASL